MLKDPVYFAGRKIRIQPEAGFGGYLGLITLCTQGLTAGGGASVLPDNGVIDGPARRPLPDNGGFPLVGDADSGDFELVTLFCQGLPANVQAALPERFRIMLDPAVLRIILLEFLLADGHYAAVWLKHDGPAAGGALINGKNFF